MTLRIAMWSGPRNISTAMMRAFENREDTTVSDEPFYASYLAATGLDHPMRAEVLASQPTDPREVAAALVGPPPGGASIWYQKHMSHHMLPGFRLDWTEACRNVFLIRPPEQVLASYVRRRREVTLEDIGFVRQAEIFDRIAQREGAAPPVLDSAIVLADPRAALGSFCATLGIAFSERMLHWPTGRRTSDGAWAEAWYDVVERSTGFAPPDRVQSFEALPAALKAIADAARPYYEAMARHRSAVPDPGRAPEAATP